MRPEVIPSRLAERRNELRDRRVGHERWLVSYADFITLMLAFFTTLYAIAAVDAGTPDSSPSTSREELAPPRPTVHRGLDATDPRILEAAARTREMTELRQHLSARLGQEISAHLVAVRLDGRGLVISLHEAGAFATGSAELSAEARALIDVVAAAIGPLENMVRVEGHTDDRPIATARYRSNWELSTARATNVVTYLVDEIGMSSERFAIAGYGEFRPHVPNDTEENRAKNRRVDIVVLTSQTASSEEPVGVASGTGDRPLVPRGD